MGMHMYPQLSAFRHQLEMEVYFTTEYGDPSREGSDPADYNEVYAFMTMTPVE